MLRDILFRGKRVSDGQWVTGFYVRADGNWHKHGIHKDWIICGASANGGWFALHNRYAVEKESVCQYTGLKDKNGKRIFEGDVVNVWREQRTIEQVDEFQKYKAVIEFGNPNHLYSWGWQLKMIDDAPVTERFKAIAADVVMRWQLERLGIGESGRVLPKNYLFFAGRDGHNWFRTEYRGGGYWDWTMGSPYEEV